MKKQVLIIDGSSFLYRAYYSMRPLHTPNGQPVHAVYGFCRMIKKLLSTFQAQHVALVWDSKGKTARHELFADYKATRQAPPSDLFDQKQLIVQFAELIGLHQVMQPGVEADDLIGSLARYAQQHDYEAIVVSSDKDLAQLLTENVHIFDAFKDITITKQSFQADKGMAVEKLAFYHALVGDASDNIPGVKGIGPKGALTLVNQFNSLDELYANLNQVASERIRNALQANKENAYLSHQLFLLRDVPVTLNEEQLIFDTAAWSKARPFFEQLGFTSLLKEIAAPQQSTMQPAEPFAHERYQFITINTPESLQQVADEIKAAGLVALDTETTGLSPLQSTMVGLSLCTRQGCAYYIPLRHTTGELQLDVETVQRVLGPIFADTAIKKVLHNAKFDLLVLQRANLPLRGLSFDTIVAASLLVPDWQRVGLKSLSLSYFDERMLTFDQVVTQKNYADFTQVPLALATNYAAADAHQTFKLFHVLEKQLRDQQLLALYENIEHPLIDVLSAMEYEGIACDAQLLGTIDAQLTKALSALEYEICSLIGYLPGAINLNSPKQLEQLLFGQLKLPPQKKSAKKTGYSTDQEVLQTLAEMHIVPRLILKYRELYKLKSTYVSALPAAINPETGHIHTSYNQISVATGRLASSEPNLQNIPVQEGELTVRSAFFAPENEVFISADYSQIELRVLAHLSQDKALLEAFLHNRDIHAQTAAGLFDTALDQVTHQQRQIGKRINFSILYGLTPYGLSKDLNISTTQAKEYIDKYFAQYPAVRGWMDQVIEQTKRTGYTQTVWGRKRAVPGIREKNRHLFEAACRIAINTCAQGTAAEIMKMGMIKLHEAFKQQNLDARIILQIHDELLIKTPHGQEKSVHDLTQKTLESVVDWPVPLKVTLRSGKTWQDVTK